MEIIVRKMWICRCDGCKKQVKAYSCITSDSIYCHKENLWLCEDCIELYKASSLIFGR